MKSNKNKGDINSFKSIFEKYYGSLVGYGTSLTGDQEASREIVQDVFLILWEKRNLIKIQDSVKSYLFKAVFNRASNWRRHELIKRSVEKNDLLDIIHDSKDQIEINPFLSTAINTAIDNLPPKARDVFTLATLDGLSHKEIGSRMGITAKTVENQLARAKKILRKQLRNYR